MVSRTLAFVAVLALTTLRCVSAADATLAVGGTIVYEFQQVGDDVKITVEGTLTTALPSVADSGDTAYVSVCAEPTATFASAALGSYYFVECCVSVRPKPTKMPCPSWDIFNQPPSLSPRPHS